MDTTRSEEELFGIVGKELSLGRVDTALWTKAFALQDGDERKTKAHYIRLRVEKLKHRPQRYPNEPQAIVENTESQPSPHSATVKINDILEATRCGDAKSVESILKINPEHVWKVDSAGNTPLHLAFGARNLEIATLLRRFGASENARNKEGITPINMPMANESASAPNRESVASEGDEERHSSESDSFESPVQNNFDQIDATTASQPPSMNLQAPPLGTMWLNFWTYISLPVGGLFGIVLSLFGPWLFLGISILQLVVAYGLHKRKLWAWNWNWIVIFAHPLISMAYAQTRFEQILYLVFYGLIWCWPSLVYWRKRKGMFS